jgi:hypothetical protein
MRDRHGVPITSEAASSEVSGVMSKGTAQKRLLSIDFLRGLAIVLMALDHTRDFFGASGPNPRDLIGAPPRHPCPCCRARLINCRRCRLSVWPRCSAETVGLRPRSFRYLRRMALSASDALSALPLVCRAQAGPAGLVVELSLNMVPRLADVAGDPSRAGGRVPTPVGFCIGAPDGRRTYRADKNDRKWPGRKIARLFRTRKLSRVRPKIATPAYASRREVRVCITFS